MSIKNTIPRIACTSVVVGTLTTCTATVQAQNSSLYQRPYPTNPPRYVRLQATEQIPALGADGANGANASVPRNGANGGAVSVPNMPAPNALDANGVSAVMPPGMGTGAPMMPNPLLGSWTYTPPTPARTLRIHDIVFIRVDENAQSIALGNTTSRKNTSYNASLKDWVRLVGLDTIKPDPQSDGDPTVQGVQTEVYRGDSTMRTSESMTFNIAAEIADIRPNGTLVLSAKRTIRLNDNTWEASLSGVCRSQDIGPDNTILSRNISDISIGKQETGHVRDGYSRGWLTKFIARVKPF